LRAGNREYAHVKAFAAGFSNNLGQLRAGEGSVRPLRGGESTVGCGHDRQVEQPRNATGARQSVPR
jgi:hypothetical protein